MTKLKTLNEIYDWYDSEEKEYFYNQTDLRANAIKWAKEEQRLRDQNKSSCFTGFTHQIRWIKHFFNLKESDLK